MWHACRELISKRRYSFFSFFFFGVKFCIATIIYTILKLKKYFVFFFVIYRSLVAQSLALDIMVWVTAIRLARLRVGQNAADTKAMQLDTIRCVQTRLPSLLRTCLLHAGRSIAHKCVKLIVICSE